MTKRAAKIRRVYQVWHYDVWGNSADGYSVNDRRKGAVVGIDCKAHVFNPGTPHEFVSYDPTDMQLALASGISGAEWGGEAEGTIYATDKRTGKPAGELEYLGPEE